MKTKFIVTLFILLVIFIGCNLEDSNSLKIDIEGEWAFLLKDSSYGEAYLYNDSIAFLTEILDYSGPFPYQVKDDTLFYADQSFQIERINCSVIELHSKSENLKLYKFYSDTGVKNYSDINPFYLRRCYYLVQKGRITMGEALQYLDSTEITEQFLEEEILLK